MIQRIKLPCLCSCLGLLKTKRLPGLLTIFFFLSFTVAYAQPANDDCADAEIVPADGSCGTFTITDATVDLANGSCVGGNLNVWFLFEAEGPDYDITVTGGPGFNPEITLIEFDPTPCDFASATQLDCGPDQITGTGLSIGTKYYVIVTSATNTAGTFELCVETPQGILPPDNDDPCSANVLTPDGTCVSGTTLGATPDVVNPNCANFSNNAVWYSVVLSTGNNSLNVNLQNQNFTGTVAVNVVTFSPDCNGSATIVAGGDYCGPVTNADFDVDGLTPGTQYFVQVATADNNAGDFDICLTESGPPPGCALNDLCSAPEIVTVPVGTTECVTGCNSGATPGPAFGAGGGCFNLPNETVWFSYTPEPTTTFMTVSVTSTDLNQPQIAIFNTTDCANFLQLQCFIGNGGSATINNQSIVPGNEYIIAISDQSGGEGFFDLCIETSSAGSNCNVDSDVSVISTSLGSPFSGPFQPGEQVEICLNINDFNSGTNTNNCQWLHGIVPTFGDCWQPSSFLPTGLPAIVTTPLTNAANGAGTWQWFQDGEVLYNNITPGYYPPGTPVGAGWFFNFAPSNGDICTDFTDPNCTYGDGAGCSDNNNYSWQVCFILTANDYPACESGPTATDCTISFRTFGDGETGGWSSQGCEVDLPIFNNLSMNCCEPPTVNNFPPTTICSGDQTSIVLTSDQDPNVTYTWEVLPSAVTGASSCLSGCGNTITQILTNSTPVTGQVIYQVTATSASGCVSFPVNITVNVLPEIDVSFVPQPPVCAGSCVQLSPIVTGGNPPYDFQWDNGIFGSSPFVCPNITTTYNVTVTDASFCSTESSVTITANSNLTVDILANPDTFICSNDPAYPIILTADVTNGGSGVYTYAWSDGSPSSFIAAPTTDFYCVTVTDVLTQCTGEVCQFIESPLAPFVLIIDPGDLGGCLNEYCLSGVPSGGVWGGVANPLGCVSPEALGQGSHEVTYTYTDPQTLCSETATFDIQVTGAPDVDPLADVTVCGTYTLPDITGTTLTGSEAYYDAPDGGGNSYSPGDVISNTTTLYIYDNDGNCSDEEVFTITVNIPPSLDPVAPVIACNSYTLPPISGNNLSGNQAYYTGQDGTGTQYNPGDVISTDINPLYIYDTAGGNQCDDEVSFTITINDQPDITPPTSPITACNFFSLPAIDGTNLNNPAYYTGPGGTGTQYNAGDMINSSIVLYLYDEVGDASCSDEETIDIEILVQPDIDDIGNVTACNNYTLPQITGSNLSGTQAYYDGPNGTGNSFQPGEIMISSVTLFIYDSAGAAGCEDEESFTITLVPQPDIQPIDDVTACASYTLPQITGDFITANAAYYTGPNGSGTSYLPGESINSSITLYAYDFTGLANCSDEESFDITITPQPDILPIQNVTACDSYQLAPISGSNLTANVAYYTGPGGTGTTYQAGDIINTSTTLYAYDSSGPGCDDEESFDITINPTPTADFTVESPICNTGTSTITFTGTASTNAIFDWNFAGGTIVSGTGAGPYEIQWIGNGTFNVSLEIDDQNCISDLVTQAVVIEAPLSEPIINCNSTTTSVEFTWGDVSGASDYIVTVISGPTGTQTTPNTYLVDGLAPNTTVEIMVEAVGNGPCGSSFASATCTATDCPDISLDITPVDDICLDGNTAAFDLLVSITNSDGSGTGVWSGPGITNTTNGTFDPNDPSVSIGANTVVFTFTEQSCTYVASTIINVYQVPTADFSLANEACIGDTLTLTYDGSGSVNADYDWNFGNAEVISGTGAGPYVLTWSTSGTATISLIVTENGCPSALASESITISDPLPPLVINCSSTTSEITFSWDDVPGATGYDVVLINGLSGTVNGNTYTVSGLTPNDSVTIAVTPLSDGICGNGETVTTTCYANNCPTIDIVLDGLNMICLDGSQSPVALTATLNGGTGNGTGQWSGPGIVDTDDGIFDPDDPSTSVGNNTVTYTYTESGCVYNSSINIELFAPPTSSFTATNPVCLDDNCLVNYDGNASANAQYSWNFAGANIISGSDQGPYQLQFPDFGTFDISLTVTDENGCVSSETIQSIEVVPPLAEPTISCNSTISSIEFNWLPINGADSYDVILSNGQNTNQTETTIFVDNLMENEEITIEVIAISNNVCSNSSSVEVCQANACPPILVIIEPEPPICLTPNVGTVILDVTIQGGDGTGFGVWSGNGIVNPLTGEFDPSDPSVVVGPNLVTYTFEENGCVIIESMDIFVYDLPDASFTVESPVCVGQISTVSVPSVIADADYTWTFGSANIVSGSDAGPYELTWDTPGTYDISLDITDDNGCVSETVTEQVEVIAPLTPPDINCNTTTSSIEFTWASVPGALGYDITVLTGQMGTQGPNNFFVDGLIPNEEVIIEMTVLGDAPCGDTIVQQSCIATDCPSIQLTIDPVSPICTDPTTPTMILTVDIVNSDGSGIGEWSGNGIVNSITGEFDPNDPSVIAGANQVTFTFTEDDCEFSDDLLITVNPIPEVEAGANQTIDCSASSVQLSGSVMGTDLIYSWTGPGIVSGANTLMPTVDLPGVYTLTAISQTSNCFSTDNVSVNQGPGFPQADAGPDFFLNCADSIAILQGNGSIGPNYQFEWSGPGIDTDNMNSQFPMVSDTGTYILQVIDNDNNCISESDTVQVFGDFNYPTALIVADPTDTIDCTIMTLALIGNEVPNTTSGWYDANAILVADTSVYYLESGTNGLFTYIIRDTLNGCADSDSVEVVNNIQYPIITLPTPGVLDCSNDEVQLDATGSQTSPSIEIEWDGPGLIGPLDGLTVTAVLPGNYTLTLTDVLNNCVNDSTVVVEEIINDPQALIDDPEDLDCVNTEVLLNGTNSQGVGPLGYQWVSNGDTIALQSSTSVENPGTYELIVTDLNTGCQDIETVTITQSQDFPTSAIIEISEPTCYGDNDGYIVIDSVLGGTPPYSYSLDGQNFTTSNLLGNLETGLYTVTIEDAAGCTWDTEINVQGPEEMTLTIGDDLLLELGDSAIITAQYTLPDGAVLDTLIWTPMDRLECIDSLDCDQVVVLPFDPFTISATLIDTNNCMVTDQIQLRVNKERLIYIPNIFTPNDDGHNDILMIYGGQSVKEISQFMIYDRWGETMFEGRNFQPGDPAYGWDGELRGEPLNPAVFVYWAEVELVDGQKIIFEGDITLIR